MIVFDVFTEATDVYRRAIRNNWGRIAHIPIDNFPDIEIPWGWRPDPRNDAVNVLKMGRLLERAADEFCRVRRHC